jgi:hypothetical protein
MKNNNQQLEESPKMANLVSQGLALTKIENETQTQIALQRPRHVSRIYDDVLKELELVPEFAAKSFYSIPYKNDMGGTTYVEGPSIKAAMGLARTWGNCSNSGRIVEDAIDRVIVEGVFIDYETGFRTLRQVSVARGYWSKQFKKVVPLREDRLNMAIQAGISKAVRNAILASLPVSLVENYLKRAKQVATATLGGKNEILKTPQGRLLKAKDMFSKLGVTETQWQEYISGSTLEIDDLIPHLLGLYNSIQDGQKTIEDVFGQNVVTPEKAEEGQIKSTELFNESKKPRKV